MARIAIEATGCDGGLYVVSEGTRQALTENSDLEIILVAGRDKIQEDSIFQATNKDISTLNNNEIYSIEEGIKFLLTENTYTSKKDLKTSSIYKAIEMHKGGDVDAVLAPGDTTGTVLASLKILERLTKNSVPCIPTHWPFNNVLIDSGAKLNCNPRDLLQFAIMGKVFSENYLNVKKPLIGVLNIGKEAVKGLDIVRKARELLGKLEKEDYNISEEYFEPDSIVGELYGGWVAVADGFSGNLVLKTAEGALKAYSKRLKEKIQSQSKTKQAAAQYALQNPVAEMKEEFDWRNYSANPLLGYKANIMISHGKSDAKAITNALRITRKYLQADINSKLEEELERARKI